MRINAWPDASLASDAFHMFKCRYFQKYVCLTIPCSKGASRQDDTTVFQVGRHDRSEFHVIGEWIALLHSSACKPDKGKKGRRV